MRIFITGAAGFIGSHLCEKLLSMNHEVIAFDNFDDFYPREIKEKNISITLQHSNYKIIEGDIRDAEKLNLCFRENHIDLVIHLAAKAGVRPSIENPGIYYSVNVLGTLTLLEAMKYNNIKKMIFASSSSVYGNNKKIPFNETDFVDFPISPYAATKKACELLCHTYHHLYHFDIFCLRLFTVYGPRQRPDLAIHRFIYSLLSNKPVTVYGDGSTKRDYTYIKDIVEGIIGAVNNLNGFNIINLGNSNPVSILEVIRLIEKITGKQANIKFTPFQAGDAAITYADIRKAGKLIGYIPCMPLEEGLIIFVEQVKNLNGQTFK